MMKTPKTPDRVTKYKNVILSRPSGVTHRGGKIVRPRNGNRVLREIETCMKAGGWVSAQTYYSEDYRTEFLNAELHWPPGI